MANLTWLSNPLGSWFTAGNWNPSQVPATGDAVTIGVNGVTVQVDVSDTAPNIASLTISGNNATLQDFGHTISVAGTVDIAAGALLLGSGTVIGTLSGGGAVEAASGGTLDLTGTVNPGLEFVILSATVPSVLKFDGTASSGAIVINSSNQKLEIGATGALTLTAAESITNGTIRVDAGGSFTENAGLAVGAGATLSDAGTVSVGGSFSNSSAVDIENGAALRLLAGGSGAGTISFVGSGDTLQIGTGGAPATLSNAVTGFAQTDTIDMGGLVANGDTYAGGVLTLTNNGAVVADLILSTPIANPVFALTSDHSGGTLITVAADTTAPSIVADNPLSVLTGESGTITSSLLNATDPDNTASQLTFTVTGGPADGTLLKNGLAVTTFTQADIDAGTIVYRENGTVVSSDRFTFTVADPVGNSTSGSFTIQIAPPPDTTPPTVTIDKPLVVGMGAAKKITSKFLGATDPDSSASQLTFTVTSGPHHGSLRVGSHRATVFTEADIQNKLVRYRNDGGPAQHDRFLFSVTDPAGNGATGLFHIRITSPSAGQAGDFALGSNGTGVSGMTFASPARPELLPTDSGTASFWTMRG